eukprot:g2100.t1
MSTGKKILFYASEIGASLGLNPYRRVSSVLPDVLFRSFPNEKERLRRSGMQTEKDKLDSLFHSSQVDKIISEKLEQCAEISNVNELNSLVKTATADISKHGVFANAKDRQTVKAEVVSRFHRRFGSAQEDSAVGDFEKVSAKENVSTIVSEAINDLNVPEHVKEKVKADALQDVEERIERELVVSTAGDVGKEVQQDSAANATVAAVSAAVHQAGVSPSARNEFLEKTVSKVPQLVKTSIKKKAVVRDGNAKWYQKEIAVSEMNRLPLIIGGRVDGFQNGKLVEIKNRVRRIPDKLPVYDLVQIHCYMSILELNSCEVVQRLRSDHATMDRQYIDFDDGFWNDTIVRGLLRVSNVIDQLISDKNDENLRKLSIYEGDELDRFVSHLLISPVSSSRNFFTDTDVVVEKAPKKKVKRSKPIRTEITTEEDEEEEVQLSENLSKSRKISKTSSWTNLWNGVKVVNNKNDKYAERKRLKGRVKPPVIPSPPPPSTAFDDIVTG